MQLSIQKMLLFVLGKDTDKAKNIKTNLSIEVSENFLIIPSLRYCRARLCKRVILLLKEYLEDDGG